MIDMSSPHRARQLAMICAGLAVLCAGIWLYPWPAIETLPPAKLAAARHDDGQGRDVDSWAGSVLSHPLFSVNRKAVRGANSLISAGGPMPRLAGIIVTKNGKSAIFMPDGDAKPLTLSEGAMIGDERIEAIAPDHVRLSGDKGVRDLRPLLDGSQKPLGSATPQPVPQPGQQPGFPFVPGGFPGVPPGGFPAFRPGMPGGVFPAPNQGQQQQQPNNGDNANTGDN
jgi:hypothetical protein